MLPKSNAAMHGQYARIEQAIAAALQHLAVHIGGPDFTLGPDAARERGSKIAAAGSDIEQPLAAARPRHCDRKSLPIAVQAERHEVVHQVVALGHAVEHLADTLRLFFLGDLAESEIDFLGHDQSRAAPAFCRLDRYSAQSGSWFSPSS